MDQVLIRKAENADIEKINLLFNKVSTLKRDLDYYQWLYSVWGRGDSFIALKNDGQVIGHYGIVDRNISFKNVTYKSCLGVQAVIDPDEKNSVSIFEITNKVYKSLEINQYDFVFGYPNINFRLIQEKIEKWKKIKLFKAYELNVNSETQALVNFDEEKYSIEFISHVAKELAFNSLGSECFFLRDVAYYERRYLKNPNDKYFMWQSKESREFSCNLIFKIYIKNNLRSCQVVDILTNKELDQIDLKKFIQDLKPFVNTFSMWPINKAVKKILVDLGFTDTAFETFFGYKAISPLAKEISFNSDFNNIDNWYLTMGDSDVF